jgi:hypothetical protein
MTIKKVHTKRVFSLNYFFFDVVFSLNIGKKDNIQYINNASYSK